MTDEKFPLDRGLSIRALALITVALFAFQFHLALIQNINWDEFNFLSQIYAFRSGNLTTALQTFHVHLLGWLSAIPVSEVDQVVAGRLAMLLATGGTVFCIYLIGSRIYDKRAAAFSAIVFLCCGYVLQHAASFRTDPLATLAMMASLALLVRARSGVVPYLVAGAIAAVGILLTIKALLYAPAFLGALLFRLASEEPRKAIMVRFLVAAITVATFYVVGWAWHTHTLAAFAPAEALRTGAGGAFDKTFLSQPLFPQSFYLIRWVLIGPAAVAILAIGIWLAIQRFVTSPGLKALALPLFAAPVLSFIFYRNAYPYFFPFILAPVSLVSGLVAAKLKNSVLRAALVIALLAPVFLQYVRLQERDQTAQRSVIAAVHEIFPKPVSYIDRNGMVSSFPKVGFFMSTWGMEVMRASGRPALAPVISESQPPLLILNSPALESAVMPSSPYTAHRLDALDERALRENYIPHWGPLWVAGKNLKVAKNVRFSIAIGGTYTLECDSGTVEIDGAEIACGNTVTLHPGTHSMTGKNGASARLRWGKDLIVPSENPPTEPIYFGFEV